MRKLFIVCILIKFRNTNSACVIPSAPRGPIGTPSPSERDHPVHASSGMAGAESRRFLLFSSPQHGFALKLSLYVLLKRLLRKCLWMFSGERAAAKSSRHERT